MASTTADVTIERHPPDPDVAAPSPQAVEVLRLVADPMRAAILARLAGESLCVCHLQEVLGAKQTLVSHHLRALREAGLVTTEPSGRFTYYRLVPGAFDAARDAVAALADASRAHVAARPC
jgi:ArsR family transcriptional regulator